MQEDHRGLAARPHCRAASGARPSSCPPTATGENQAISTADAGSKAQARSGRRAARGGGGGKRRKRHFADLENSTEVCLRNMRNVHYMRNVRNMHNMRNVHYVRNMHNMRYMRYLRNVLCLRNWRNVRNFEILIIICKSAARNRAVKPSLLPPREPKASAQKQFRSIRSKLKMMKMCQR